ncbi:MAG: FliI/YscN family ATPase [Kofleriaceae bacterium]
MTARILDGQVFDAEVEARAIRAAAAAEVERVHATLSAARAAAERDLARARAEADGARREAARVRADAGLPAAEGHVTELVGLTVRARCPGVAIGEVVRISRAGWAADHGDLAAEVVGFTDDAVVLSPLGELAGVAPGAAVVATGAPLTFPCGPALLGRILDGLGRPLDGAPVDAPAWAIDRAAPSPLTRPPVTTPLTTGVRAIDGLCTLGKGQRVGLFAAAGVGKSTLLAQIAAATDADVIVLALVGERGRELGDWLDRLGPARARTVVVCATSDEPSLARVRAAFTATAVAEYFRDQGQDVLLLCDSLTRVARAQREVGLSAGEPPARHGYPPSVFALLPRLCERAGAAARGSITAVYTVLVAGNDLDEPIADEVRGIVDGHLVLDRRLAGRGHFPPVDVVASVSRMFPALATAAQADAAAVVRRRLAIYDEHRDLLAVGAYKPGADRALDQAVAAMPAVERFLRQGAGDSVALADAVAALVALAER